MVSDPFGYGVTAYPTTNTIRWISWDSSYAGTKTVSINIQGLSFTLATNVNEGPNTASFTVPSSHWGNLINTHTTGFTYQIMIDSDVVQSRFVPIVGNRSPDML